MSEKSLNFLFILTEMSTGGIALENSPEEKKTHQITSPISCKTSVEHF